ncbi:phosphopantetheine-binding protein [Tumebacillus sp. DT12]|uniref:Acyl carrier protein n=1 Tax=Tumebacillus lacus TaxID=2995335 RepID=A0ABT3X5T1_9BACL|nr:phosphopantetheine-binding protein [Tumebacillus lacus]MCX7571781.1 phosphopantetheine-binding protein [Tumebacillus lacus]
MTQVMALEEQVKAMIIERLGLEVDASTVDVDAPIFSSFDAEGEGLGLDSIDALELVVALNETFDIQVGDEDMAVFRSIQTIADFIREKKGE